MTRITAPVVLDIAGTTLTKADKQRLKHPLTGGLILFARNFENREQLTRLCRKIKKARPDVLIAVDHEGGRVQRFKTDGFTHLPPMRALGRLWEAPAPDGASLAHDTSAHLHATNVATACGYVLGAELRACGVDLSFTPVLDLDHGPSGVIGDRAFARDARVATVLAKSVMHGLLQSGMANCGKHFPGHGYVRGDSHLSIPVDDRPLATILADDAMPYQWLSSSLASVMPAHVIYSQVDSRPAGFSSKWLQDILRAQMGFQGLVFSDDLSMAAARVIDGQPVSYTTAALAALQAGCDMVLLCNQSLEGSGEAVDELLAGLSEAIVKGQWVPHGASEERRLALLPTQPALSWDELMTQGAYMHALDLVAGV
ncbi:MAG: beta-N-acetylhexosaminidase [Burkholderiales bacterium]|nr:beta-N-acetylhexosaminidase [Burkholderiales bacterium]